MYSKTLGILGKDSAPVKPWHFLDSSFRIQWVFNSTRDGYPTLILLTSKLRKHVPLTLYTQSLYIQSIYTKSLYAFLIHTVPILTVCIHTVPKHTVPIQKVPIHSPYTYSPYTYSICTSLHCYIRICYTICIAVRRTHTYLLQ